MFNTISEMDSAVHAETQQAKINPNSRFGKLLQQAEKWGEDVNTFSTKVDNLKARVKEFE